MQLEVVAKLRQAEVVLGPRNCMTATNQRKLGQDAIQGREFML